MTRVVLAAGWQVHHEGRLVAGGEVFDVGEDLAAHWIARGWVVPAPVQRSDRGERPAGRLPGGDGADG